MPQKILKLENIIKAVPKKISIFSLPEAPLILEFFKGVAIFIFSKALGLFIYTQTIRLTD